MSAKTSEREARQVSVRLDCGTATLSLPASWLDARAEGEPVESLIFSAAWAERINAPVHIISEIAVSEPETPEFTWATFKWRCGKESGNMGIALDTLETEGFDYLGDCKNDQVEWLRDLAAKAMAIGNGWPSRDDVRRAFDEMDKVIRFEREIGLYELAYLLDNDLVDIVEVE